MTIIHISLATSWRGREQQITYILTDLLSKQSLKVLPNMRILNSVGLRLLNMAMAL